MQGKCDLCKQTKDVFYANYEGWCMDCFRKYLNSVTMRLVEPAMDKNWSLQLWDKSEGRNVTGVGIMPVVKSFVMSFLKTHEKQHWFLQGDSDGWLMFEFWTADQDYIFNTCTEISDAIGLKLEIGGWR